MNDDRLVVNLAHNYCLVESNGNIKKIHTNRNGNKPEK